MEVVSCKEKLVRFKKLEQGDYFKYESFSYIKCEEYCSVNAVCLNNGTTAVFDEYDEVEKINAKIVEG